MVRVMENGKRLAYIRVSSIDQNEARQKEALKDCKIDKYFIEKVSGKNAKRPKLQEMLEYMREGDTVYVEDFTRLGRSTEDLLFIVRKIEEKGVRFVSLKEKFDATTPAGRLQRTMMAAIAEFEREIILERQREGIAIAKREGKYKGRKKIVIPEIEKYYRQYMTRKANKTQIAEELKISRQTLNKLFRELEEKQEKEKRVDE